jgi:hypothetical protein
MVFALTVLVLTGFNLWLRDLRYAKRSQEYKKNK